MSFRRIGQKLRPGRRSKVTAALTTLGSTDAVADAIDRAFPTAKHAARAAETNEPTARNWKRRRATPSLKHALELMRNSREFTADVLKLAGYDQEALAFKLDADLEQTKARLTQLMKNWDEIKGRNE